MWETKTENDGKSGDIEDGSYFPVHKGDGVRIGYLILKGPDADRMLIEVDLYINGKGQDLEELRGLIGRSMSLERLGFTISIGDNIDISCSKVIEKSDLKEQLSALMRVLKEGGDRP